MGANLQGFVGTCHEEGKGDVLPSWEGGFEYQREMGEALAKRDGKVGERVNQEMFAHGGRGDRCPPIQREVVGGQTFRKVS